MNYSSGEVTLKEYSIINFSFFDNHNNITTNRKVDPQISQMNDFMLFSGGNEMLSNEDFNNMDNCHGIVHFQPESVKINEDSNEMEIDDDNGSKDNESISEKFTLLKKPKNKKKDKKIAQSQPLPIDSTLKCSSFPDLSTLDEESLREECKKYGIKANCQSTVKIMQNTLKEIFTFLSTSKSSYIKYF